MNNNISLSSACVRVLGELEQAHDLSPETIDHTEICPLCQQELALRRGLRDRLKAAAKAVETPPFLEARIRANMQQARPRKAWQVRWVVVAAVVVLCLAGTVAYRSGHLAWTSSGQQSYIASVSSGVAKLMQVGLGDHIHCAVFRKYPKGAPPVQALGHDLGAQYAGLVPALAKQLPADFQLVMAHQCRYNDRQFVHLTARSSSGLMSLVLAHKQAGESFRTGGLVSALTRSGISFYETGAQRFQITAFETADHLVYLVSDLPSGQNTAITAAVAPEVASILNRIGGRDEQKTL